MTRQQQFIDEAVAAAKRLIEKGESDVTWSDVAAERIAPSTPSKGDIASILAERRTLRQALQTEGYAVVPVNEVYFERSDDPADEPEIRKMLPVVPNGMEVGIRVCADGNDLFWQVWQREQAKKFNGGVRSMGEQVLAQAGRDGQTAPAKALISDALKAPHKALGTPIQTVLGSSSRSLLGGKR